MSTPSRAELLAALAGEEAHLAGLKRDISAAEVRLAELRRQLQEAPAAAPVAQPTMISAGGIPPATNVAKLALSRTLFRGREDVFPRRWENARTGRSGYSPACGNVWDDRLCEKRSGSGAGRRATCAECPHQAFIPVTDEEVARHFRGEQVMGVYPLLPDETCWLLAADFDKKSCQVDLATFVETCEAHGVPVLTKMFGRRLRGYRAIGYVRDEAPPAFQETEGEAGLDADDRSPGLEQEPCRQVR